MNPETPITETLTQDSQENLLTHYQEILDKNPEDLAVLHKLAELYYQQGKLEESISYYRRLWQVENSQEAILCFQLGQSQEQAGQLEEAITSYLDAIRQSPETFDYYHRLGETLVKFNQPHQWEKTIALYQRIISLKPDIVWVYHFLGDALRNTQEWEGAFQAYRKAISLKPDFFWSYLFLGDCAKELQQWEEVIKAYQQALEIKPEVTYLHDNIGEAYYQLGKKYIEQNQLEKAAQYYQKALEKQPHQKQVYCDLKEMIAKGFYELGIQNTENGNLSAGIKCFENLSMIQTKGNIYDHIWGGLNSPGFLDEASFYCEDIITRETVEAYFTNTSSYRIIRLWDVTADDQEYLKKVDLSLVQIELTNRDQRSLEEIYMNSFLENPTIKKYSQKELRNERFFQQSIIETGYIYSVCPFSGKIIRSNQSYVIGDIWPTPVHFYRFEGKEIFYLLVGDWIGNKMYIYIPSIELIIQLRHLVSNLQGVPLFNKFKAYLVSEWKEVIPYINKSQKEVAAILGFFSNIGHYTWNDLTGIQYLYERDMLDNIDKFIVGTMEYFNVSDIWQENIPPNKRIQVKDPQNLFKTILNRNCFTLRITDISIKEDLVNRITKSSYKRCSQEFLQQIEIAKQSFPLVCFQIRTHIRFWLSQIEGIANIINKLSKDYPNLGVVFDGWSRTEIDSPGDNEMIARENREVAKIIDRLDKKTKVYNAIGCKTYEKVVWAQTIDTYIAPSGSGLTFLSTIANKMGIVHGDSEFYHNRIKVDLSLSRENGIPPLLVPGYPLEGDVTRAIHRNYECDWSAIYDEVVKIIQSSFQPER